MSSEYETAAGEVQRMFAERGTKVLNEIEATVLRGKIECKEANGALSFFMSRWRDVVRPALVSIACEAVGGDPSATGPIGKSLSLLSGATDIHDDIIDKTKAKGKKKTVLGEFGVDISMMAGDALIFEGFVSLFEGLARLSLSPEKKLAIVHTVKDLYFEMFDGEALELKFRARTDVKPEEYLHVLKKKAADVEACMRVGAMLGNGSKEQVDAVGEYGKLLGTMVLLRNDVEDMIAPDLLNLRIKNESLPLPVLYALENCEKRDEILAILKTGKVTRKGAERLSEVISEAGGINRIEELLMDIKNQAKTKLRELNFNKTFETILKATAPERI